MIFGDLTPIAYSGRQTAKTDAKGQTITYGYDKRGRLATRTYPNGSAVSFAYTPTGKRSTATDSRGATTYTYDSRNRLTQVTVPEGKTIGYGYDANSRLKSITGPAGTIAYNYSDSGRLTTVTDPAGESSSYSYDSSGNRTGLAYPNGASVSYAYDINNRLTNLNHYATVGQIASYAYTLGAIGNRTRIDEANGISRQYEYDKLYRLTKEQVTDPANTQSYSNDFTYDAVDNRLNRTKTPVASPVVSTDYSYNAADQLVSENGVTYTYDLNGSLTSKTDGGGTTTYAYDYDNRMIRVTSPTGTTTYAYDSDGNRVESASAAETVKYLIDTNRSLSQVLGEYKSDGTLIASYTYADDLISMTRGGQTYWYHFDGLGSTRMLTDESGTVTDTYDYDAFGNLIVKTGTTENPFLFTGQQYDANIGFYHLRARYYQPEAGRFTTVDPWEGDVYAPATLHRYLYTQNDPVNKLDPSGRTVLTQFLRLAYRILLPYGYITAMAFGRFAHRMIQKHVIIDSKQLPDAIPEFTVIGGRVDIFDDPYSEIYEIKPDNDPFDLITPERSAQKQIYNYIKNNPGYKQGTQYLQGYIDNPGGILGIYIQYYSPTPGIVLYEPRVKPQIYIFVISSISALAMTDLCMQIQTRTMLPALAW